MEVEKRTRGHTLKIHKKVVNNCNALPAEAVSCTTVFKGKNCTTNSARRGSYIRHIFMTLYSYDQRHD